RGGDWRGARQVRARREALVERGDPQLAGGRAGTHEVDGAGAAVELRGAFAGVVAAAVGLDLGGGVEEVEAFRRRDGHAAAAGAARAVADAGGVAAVRGDARRGAGDERTRADVDAAAGAGASAAAAEAFAVGADAAGDDDASEVGRRHAAVEDDRAAAVAAGGAAVRAAGAAAAEVG